MLSRATKSVADTSVVVSKAIFNKTREGWGKLMASSAVNDLKSKFRDMVVSEHQKENFDNSYPTFGEENTATTLPKSRRQSNCFYNRKFSNFYDD